MEIFLNIIPQHFIRTEIRRIIKYIQTIGAALKKFFQYQKLLLLLFQIMKWVFTAIMIPQKTNQPMQYWSEKIRKMWHAQNGGKWLS